MDGGQWTQASRNGYNLRDGVLAAVEKDLTAEEPNEQKKHRLAEIGMSMLENPEGNIKHLKQMLQICKNEDRYILDIGLIV
ncbi:putative nucleolar complex-associated protein [Helianthus annuus]|nr:putative nucleolar complex-associated protein [Helianthus annuus]